MAHFTGARTNRVSESVSKYSYIIVASVLTVIFFVAFVSKLIVTA